MFKRSGTGNYAYTAARVKAKKSKLLKAEDYNKLLMMSVPEISRYISEAGYSKEMTDMATSYSGLELVEYATYGNMAKAFRSILGAASGDCKNMVGAYLKKWDYTNVVTILRGKRFGLSAEDIRADLVPAGYLDSDDLDKLMQYSSVEEVLNGFSAAAHVHIPDDVVAAYKTEDILAPIEDFFTKAYYRELLAAVDKNDQPTKVFRNYVRYSIDALNIETLLKLKSENVDGETIMGYYVPGGYEVDEKVMSQLASSADLSSLLNDMQQLKMYADIKDSLSADATVSGIVNALTHYVADLAATVSALYPLSVLPVVDYMLHKEREVRNIRLLAYGTNSGLDGETVKALLVI